jgi:small subunit ribosomal protein S20
MPQHKSAIKRVRTNARDTLRNRHYKTLMKTQIKKVLAQTSREQAEVEFRRVSSVLDKLASKGIIHRNRAANQKARLARFVNTL